MTIEWIAAEASGNRWDAFNSDAPADQQYQGNVQRIGPHYYVATLRHGSKFSASNLRIVARWLAQTLEDC